MTNQVDAEMVKLADSVVREMHSVLPTRWDRECLHAKVLHAFYLVASMTHPATPAEQVKTEER